MYHNRTNNNAAVIILAKMALGAMVSKRRDNGDSFYSFGDDSEQWRELSRAAHQNGEILPEDFRYEVLNDYLHFVTEQDADADLDELMHEFADNNVSVYNADRTAWLASALFRAGYVEDAREEFGSKDADLFTQLGWGMYAENCEIAAAVLEWLRANVDEDTSDDEAAD